MQLCEHSDKAMAELLSLGIEGIEERVQILTKARFLLCCTACGALTFIFFSK